MNKYYLNLVNGVEQLSEMVVSGPYCEDVLMLVAPSLVSSSCISRYRVFSFCVLYKLAFEHCALILIRCSAFCKTIY